jgi:hypothetical protein
MWLMKKAELALREGFFARSVPSSKRTQFCVPGSSEQTYRFFCPNLQCTWSRIPSATRRSGPVDTTVTLVRPNNV